MTGKKPKTAMVLAAGLGKRMRPITDRLPKPLVPVAGRPLLDWGLDMLAASGVEKAVVNVHYLPDQIIAHVAARRAPRIIISDERDGLLDSAGGIVKALPLIGAEPFYVLNADTFWIDEGQANLVRLALAWDAARMDILLMLSTLETATGHSGGTDFILAGDGRLSRSRGDPAGADTSSGGAPGPSCLSNIPEGLPGERRETHDLPAEVSPARTARGATGSRGRSPLPLAQPSRRSAAPDPVPALRRLAGPGPRM